MRNATGGGTKHLQDIPPPSCNVSIFYLPFTYMIYVGVTVLHTSIVQWYAPLKERQATFSDIQYWYWYDIKPTSSFQWFLTTKTAGWFIFV
jgi:hypothetical protein